jgi:hypothetical protein
VALSTLASTTRSRSEPAGRAKSTIDLVHQHLAEGIGSFRAQPTFLEVLGKSS